MRRFFVALAVLSLVAIGCGEEGAPEDITDEAAPVGRLEVSAVDDGEGGGYAFELPASVPAGATEIVLTNTGAEPHHAQLFKLDDDATMDDLGAQLATGDPASLVEVGAFAGGTSSVDPGGTSSANAIAELTEGSYVFMCFIENAEEVPHLAGGMLTPFEVTANDDPPAAPEPDDDVLLNDVDGSYGFTLPEAISAGDDLLMTNTSDAEPHEMAVMRLAEGAEAADVLAFVSGEGPEGPPPFSAVGGMQALMPGRNQTLSLDVEPGRYVLACFIPSAADGVPHGAKGMIEVVEVT